LEENLQHLEHEKKSLQERVYNLEFSYMWRFW
jgi:hypothetical protein